MSFYTYHNTKCGKSKRLRTVGTGAAWMRCGGACAVLVPSTMRVWFMTNAVLRKTHVGTPLAALGATKLKVEWRSERRKERVWDEDCVGHSERGAQGP